MCYSVRKMKRDEIGFAIEEAARQGWNPGLHDGGCFFDSDPNGFFIGLHNGEPVGCISAVAYGDEFGFIGFYIVKPEHQNTQVAVMLSLAARNYLGNRNIGLDGVFERQENYAALGFEFAYSNIRFESIGQPANIEGLVSAKSIPFEDLSDYDAMCFPVRRDKFLRMWLDLPNVVSLASLSDGKLQGYGVIRSCRSGFKIGPLFANNAEIAGQLFLGLSANAIGQPVYFDIPEINAAAMAIAAKYNMKRVFGTARMYSKAKPAMDYEKIYGITSFELG